MALKVTLPQKSQWVRSNLQLDPAGVLYFGVRKPLSLKPSATDRYHQVKDDDRIDLIAHDYLGDVRLWWVILDVNQLADHYSLEPGMILRIPAAERLTSEVLRNG